MRSLTLIFLIYFLSLNPWAQSAELAIDSFKARVRVYSDRIIIGSSPHSLENFELLRSSGVSTIISVDGALPKIELAKSLDLKYFHIPIGYDRIKRSQLLEMAKIYLNLEGKLYIHCHKGLHRGPAAAACLMVASGESTPDQGVKLIKQTGTSSEYSGLFRSVHSTKPITRDELSETKFPPESRNPSDLVHSMKVLENHFENLVDFKKNDWLGLRNSPDLSAAHESLMLHEGFIELHRLESSSKTLKPDGPRYQRLMEQGITFSMQLRNELKNANQTEDKKSFQTRNLLVSRIKKTCAECHKNYRN